MKNEFINFKEWIKTKDLELYNYFVESNVFDRRSFLQKGIGAAAAALTGAGISKAAEPKMPPKSANDQPAWKNANLRGPIIEFDKDDYGRTEYKNILVTIKIPDNIKLRIRNTRDLKLYCVNAAKTNSEILFQTMLLLKKELKNPNINTKNVYIHVYDVNLYPADYVYETSDKNVKFSIRVMYFDTKTKEPIDIEEMSIKK